MRRSCANQRRWQRLLLGSAHPSENRGDAPHGNDRFARRGCVLHPASPTRPETLSLGRWCGPLLGLAVQRQIRSLPGEASSPGRLGTCRNVTAMMLSPGRMRACSSPCDHSAFSFTRLTLTLGAGRSADACLPALCRRSTEPRFDPARGSVRLPSS